MDKLDALCSSCEVMLFSDILDSTDMQINLDVIELPEGMESTDELMAQQGVWASAAAVLHMLETLLHKIETDNIRFGTARNAREDIVAELQESIAFAREAVTKSAKFNFGVVM